MMSLDGLWKDKNREVLVHLHGTSMMNYPRNLRNVKGGLRVVEGSFQAMDVVYPFIFISVMPKRKVTIQVVDVAYHHEGLNGCDYYSFEGVVIHTDPEYGPGPAATMLAMKGRSMYDDV